MATLGASLCWGPSGSYSPKMRVIKSQWSIACNVVWFYFCGYLRLKALSNYSIMLKFVVWLEMFARMLQKLVFDLTAISTKQLIHVHWKPSNIRLKIIMIAGLFQRIAAGKRKPTLERASKSVVLILMTTVISARWIVPRER